MLRYYCVSEFICRYSYKYIRFWWPYCHFRLSVVAAIIRGHWPWRSLIIAPIDRPWSVFLSDLCWFQPFLHVGAFLTPSTTHVRKNRSAIRGLSFDRLIIENKLSCCLCDNVYMCILYIRLVEHRSWNDWWRITTNMSHQWLVSERWSLY